MSTRNQVSDTASDPDLFECFYRDHIEQVRTFVSRRVSDARLATDLTSEIFLAAIDAAPSYRPDRGSASAWLHGIARNVVADEVRRQVRQLHAVRRIAGRRLLDSESLARIEERIDAERKLRSMYQALQQLTEAERCSSSSPSTDWTSPRQPPRSTSVHRLLECGCTEPANAYNSTSPLSNRRR